MNTVRLVCTMTLIAAVSGVRADPQTSSKNLLLSKFTYGELRNQYIVDKYLNVNNAQAFAYGDWLIKNSKGGTQTYEDLDAAYEARYSNATNVNWQTVQNVLVSNVKADGSLNVNGVEQALGLQRYYQTTGVPAAKTATPGTDTAAPVKVSAPTTLTESDINKLSKAAFKPASVVIKWLKEHPSKQADFDKNYLKQYGIPVKRFLMNTPYSQEIWHKIHKKLHAEAEKKQAAKRAQGS